jgi:hypothetical protein
MIELDDSEGTRVKQLSKRIETVARPEVGSQLTKNRIIIVVASYSAGKFIGICENNDDIRRVFDEEWDVIEWRAIPKLHTDLFMGPGYIALTVTSSEVVKERPLPNEFWVIKSDWKILRCCKKCRRILAFNTFQEAEVFIKGKGTKRALIEKISRSDIERLADLDNVMICVDFPGEIINDPIFA